MCSQGTCWMVRELISSMKSLQRSWIMSRGGYIFPEEQGGEGQTFITRLKQRVIVQANMWEKLKQAMWVTPMTASLLPRRLPNPASFFCQDILHSLLLSVGLGMKKAFVLGPRGSPALLAFFPAWRKAARKPRSPSPCKVCLKRNLPCLSASLGGSGRWD